MMAMQHSNRFKTLADLVGWDRPVSAVLAGIPVRGLQLDSRCIGEDDVFIACKGVAQDGRDFIREAVAMGAVAVLAERDEQWPEDRDCDGVPVLVVDQLSHKVSELAAVFYDHPGQQLPVVGVTGTNGKTSCTQLMGQLLHELDQSCGILGTLGVGLYGQLQAGINTTPDAISIQRHLADWLQASLAAAAMEVSSHGLEQGRVAAVPFRVAIFTNLSRDHLDYHGTMQAYGEAKLELFQQAGLRVAVINADDEFAETVVAAMPDEVQVLRYSLSDSSADIYARAIEFSAAAVRAELVSPWGVHSLRSPLLGNFNLANLLAALAALASLGYSLAELCAACNALTPVSGRMEKIAFDSDIEVVVDYAHTPDALANALQALRPHTRGQLWCVFGCGGDRDQGKRPEMGRIAEQLADQVVVTSDNPRSENADTIVNDILIGVAAPALVETDRAKAIAYAISQARPGDSILLAGKGHEDYQQVGEQRLPFSDLQQARLALQQRRAGGEA